MKCGFGSRVGSVLIGLVIGVTPLPAEPAESWLRGWGEFDPGELRALVDGPVAEFGHSENREVMELVLQAAVAKDESFRDLLERQDLREANNVDLALSAYEFMLDGKRAALDRILAQLATEDIGADVDTTLVLAFVDEWDRTVRAVRKHFFRTDGAGGTNWYFFRTTRAALYPEKYAEMREVIEAPIVWPGSLVPEGD